MSTLYGKVRVTPIEGGGLRMEHDSEGERLQRIEDLERRQHRAMRELSLDPDNADARARLQAIDAQIAQLRAG